MPTKRSCCAANCAQKDIHLLVVKNSMARRATEGTPLAPAFEGVEGTLAVVWGGEDFISLVKEVTRLDKSNEYEQFEARGGVMDGEQLTADRVREISKWPNRQEQLSILSGQILSPGAQLSSQLIGPGGALASQIEKKVRGVESEDQRSAAVDAQAAGSRSRLRGWAAGGRSGHCMHVGKPDNIY